MQRDREYLLDVPWAATLASRYLRGIDNAKFLEDFQLQDAVVRRLEIVGEATTRLSEETRAMDAGIPWPKMIAMRNHLIHRYDNIDLDVVWQTATGDLPVLITRL